jgi:hypothetical protein
VEGRGIPRVGLKRERPVDELPDKIAGRRNVCQCGDSHNREHRRRRSFKIGVLGALSRPSVVPLAAGRESEDAAALGELHFTEGGHDPRPNS